MKWDENFHINAPSRLTGMEILGPLLFLIYINDLPKCLNHSKSILYADDTLLCYFEKTATALQTNIDSDLQSLSNWLNENLLTLNYEKTKFLFFALDRKHLKSYSNINITINNQKIKQGKSIRYQCTNELSSNTGKQSRQTNTRCSSTLLGN